MWVLPGILKAEKVGACSLQVLELVSTISTGVVLGYVNKFISANESSSDPVIAEAAGILKQAYEGVNKINDYLNSDEAKNLADTLCSLQYSDVSAESPTEQLVVYRNMILELLADDVEFLKTYKKSVEGSVSGSPKMAYTARLDEDNYMHVMGEIYGLIQKRLATMEDEVLYNRIVNNKNLFINSTRKLNAPTVLRRAIYKKDMLKSILRGLDFLLEKKEAGESPRVWRRV